MVDSVIAGRYRLDRRIGTGGMSEVWAATDLDLGRSVAVKLLASDADPARFEQEARAAAGLAHANVCAVYDYGDAGGRRFMVLELLPGGSLEDRLSGGRPLPDSETQRVAAEIAAGLAHAHERGLVHRDLKPANILFDAGGRAKIADFGIARAVGASGLTEVGTVMGTAAYISPEQARGDPATPASDVYAFGVILFRMLTGRLPFESSDAFALAAMHRDLPAPSVSELRPDAPPLLESVAGAALAKSPVDRPQDGAALGAELRHAAPAIDYEATAVTQVVPPRLTTRRRRLLLALALAAVAAAGVGLALAVTLGNGTTPVPVSTSQPSTTAATTAPAPPPPESEPATTTPVSTGTTTPPRTTTAAATTTAPATTRPATTAPATRPVTTKPATTAPTPPPPTTTSSAPTAPTTTAVPTAPATTAPTTSQVTTTTATPASG